LGSKDIKYSVTAKSKWPLNSSTLVGKAEEEVNASLSLDKSQYLHLTLRTKGSGDW